MNRKLVLLFSIFAAVPFGIQAQTNAPKPVAVRWIAGETGASNTESDRPRIVPAKAEQSRLIGYTCARTDASGPPVAS